jgi:type IV pilus assembly protein PilQ
MRALLLTVLVLSSSAFASAPKVTVEFQRADVHSVLRLFAELGHLNLVTDESVSGSVTLSLRNVRWDEAFQVVLNARGAVTVDARTNTLIVRDVE